MRKIIPLVLIAFLFLTQCAEKKVASVNGRKITEKEFKIFRENHKGSDIKELIKREVCVEEAKIEKINTSEKFKKSKDDIKNALLVKFYLKNDIVKFSLEDAKKVYFQHTEQREASHILTKTREECELAKNRIKNGEPFDKIAKEVSIDAQTKENGGNLGFIRRGMTVLPFEDALFSAKRGDLVGPIKTEYGYHLILVGEIKNGSEEDFEKNRERILEMINREQEQSAIRKLSTELRNKYPLKIYDGVLDLDRTTQVASNDENMITGEVCGEKISLKDLKDFMRENLKISGEGHSMGAKTKASFMEIMADEIRIVKEAKTKGIDKSEDFNLGYNDALSDRLAQLYKENFLNNLKISDEELLKYFQEKREKFKKLSKVNIEQIVVDDFAKATEVLNIAKNGTSFSEIYEKWADKDATGKWDVGLIPFELLKNVFAESTMKEIEIAKEGQIIGPIKSNEGFIIVKISEKHYEGYKDFSDVKDELKKSYVEENGESLFEENVNNLLNKFKIKIY
jgi:parvulin-like peptidyl-prolyl isomerase